MPRNLLKILLLLLTLCFALVWAKALPYPAWLPGEIEPLTVIAGNVIQQPRLDLLRLGRTEQSHRLDAPGTGYFGKILAGQPS